MAERLNFPNDSNTHAYLTTDNAGDDLQIAVLDGDLVVLDANENPVLRWDASATQWDFVGGDIAGVGSITTDQASISGVAEGSTSLFLDAVNSGEGREDSVQETDGVSTSATAIWDGSSTSVAFGALLVVYGTGTNVTARFSDIVHFHRNNSAVDVINTNESGTPAGRTYSRASDNVTLELAMASDTYDIAVSAVASRGSD